MEDEDYFYLGVIAAIVTILCGVYITKPHLHGIKFVEGECRVTAAAQTRVGDFPRCSCGKNCNRDYPCLSIQLHPLLLMPLLQQLQRPFELHSQTWWWWEREQTTTDERGK
eukprot:sb/3477114/